MLKEKEKYSMIEKKRDLNCIVYNNFIFCNTPNPNPALRSRW